MPPTYYVIELSARWLTALLVALALALVMAFAFGYGAAWSVLSSAQSGGLSTPVAATPTPEDATVVPTAVPVTPSVATPVVVASPTPAPEPTVRPTSSPRPTASPQTTAAPATAPPVRRVEQAFWVQVLAAGRREAINAAQLQLVDLGFPAENQRMVQSRVAGGNTLFKLRVGPFPDRQSADRVVRRMQELGFPGRLGRAALSFGGSVPSAVLPEWIRSRKLSLAELHEVKRRMRGGGLHTVCEEARCPNRSECFGRGTATFLINGRVCTRNCAYCAISHGRPSALHENEAAELVEAVTGMELEHVVITAVDRDDLEDGGAGGFVQAVRLLKDLPDPPTVEVLTPDFRGQLDLVDRILDACPEIYNHNVETVPRLFRELRRSGRYDWALEVLARVAAEAPAMVRKSGMMVGLGETRDEVAEVLADLKNVGCQVVTIGQYLQPTPEQVKVQRYWRPEEFDELASAGEQLGLEVFAGPFVRSSYRAEEAYLKVIG